MSNRGIRAMPRKDAVERAFLRDLEKQCKEKGNRVVLHFKTSNHRQVRIIPRERG